jgi:hypothetical protein
VWPLLIGHPTEMLRNERKFIVGNIPQRIKDMNRLSPTKHAHPVSVHLGGQVQEHHLLAISQRIINRFVMRQVGVDQDWRSRQQTLHVF